MFRHLARLKEWLHREDGAAAMEYALMVSIIVVAALVGITTLGTSINSGFADYATKIG